MAEILREQDWLLGEASPEQLAWCERAAALLGPHVRTAALSPNLLHLVFHYDAQEILAKVESHSVLSRYCRARRRTPSRAAPARWRSSHHGAIQGNRHGLKDRVGLRSRELFHPIRLALAGRAGEGELDRVILLLDEAAALPFAVPVKSARERILEFCAALD